MDTSDAANRLLALVEPTDRGVEASPQLRDEIGSLIDALELSYRGVDAFSQPEYLFRRTEVVYVGQARSDKANAAGGKYRGKVGRALFKTDALFQHVLEGASAPAVNVINFKLLGLLSGAAVMPGSWRRVVGDELTKLQARAQSRNAARPPMTDNVIAVDFSAPRLSFPRNGALTVQFGPASNVRLEVTYLDERIRICRGGENGTPFVFRADTCAAGAPLAAASQMWERTLARRPLGKRSLIPLLITAAALSWTGAARGGGGLRAGAMRTVAVGLAAAAAAIARSTGGIVVEQRQAPDTPSAPPSAPPSPPPLAPPSATAPTALAAAAPPTPSERAARLQDEGRRMLAERQARLQQLAARQAQLANDRQNLAGDAESPVSNEAESSAEVQVAPRPASLTRPSPAAAKAVIFGVPPSGYDWGGLY